MTPILFVLQSWKKLQVLEKKIFEKKNLPACLYRKDLQNRGRNFFLMGLRFRKIVLHYKIIDKTI